jgi:hypothetical protein
VQIQDIQAPREDEPGEEEADDDDDDDDDDEGNGGEYLLCNQSSFSNLWAEIPIHHSERDGPGMTSDEEG